MCQRCFEGRSNVDAVAVTVWIEVRGMVFGMMAKRRLNIV
jgi:hypothetical protein